MDDHSGFSPVLFVGICRRWYNEEYSSWRLVVLDVSVVVILDSTPSAQAALTFFSKLSNVVSAGISFSTLLQACLLEMKDTPTREVTLVELNVKTAPSRDSEA